MGDLTANVQRPQLGFVAPIYTTVQATDFFTAAPNAAYVLKYKNGATAQASGAIPNKVTDATSVAPSGVSLAGGWADVPTSPATGMAATSEAVVTIPNTNRFRDGQGRINLSHAGTLTTVQVAIIGPFPPLG